MVYIMSRDQRIDDNHALLLAQQSALSSELPLVIAFNLSTKVGVRSREHYKFMLDGLRQVAAKAADLGIAFVLRSGGASEEMVRLLKEIQPKEVFFDFSPLRGSRATQKKIAESAECRCSVVDTHNIVPAWLISDKEEFAAHTFRPKIHRNLADWLVEPASIVQHPYKTDKERCCISWEDAQNIVNKVQKSGIKPTVRSDETAAVSTLDDYIANKLDAYAVNRNDPNLDAQSNLSPYLHFGQISSLRVALRLISVADSPPLLLRQAKLASFEGTPKQIDNINALLEELIVRKELADNYCYYNEHYDSLAGARKWAKVSLQERIDDTREFTYSLRQWENAETHDNAWNAAQNQLTTTGKMHGYMRMYWAKKILEWSPSPEEAIKTAVYLNDHYSLDGGDPNGYTGIMWSIAGVHDRPWFDRSVYGKIRYMNYGGLKRKFDIKAYQSEWT